MNQYFRNATGENAADLWDALFFIEEQVDGVNNFGRGSNKLRGSTVVKRLQPLESEAVKSSSRSISPGAAISHCGWQLEACYSLV